jgi:hypothetical protein
MFQTKFVSSSSSSSSSSICHGVGPLVDPFWSHVSRSLFTVLPWFILPVGELCFIILGNLLRCILFTCCIQFLFYSSNLSLNMPVQRLKVAILPLDWTCSGPVTHSGKILTFICLRVTTLSYDVAHRTVRSWRQNSFDCFSRWPWNTLRNYMCGVPCCRKEWGGSAIRWVAWSADCGGGGGETVNRKIKLSAVFLEPIQNPSYMSHVLLLCITFLRVLVVLYLRVTCICVA